LIKGFFDPSHAAGTVHAGNGKVKSFNWLFSHGWIFLSHKKRRLENLKLIYRKKEKAGISKKKEFSCEKKL
jgi:hypothetical protein